MVIYIDRNAVRTSVASLFCESLQGCVVGSDGVLWVRVSGSDGIGVVDTGVGKEDSGLGEARVIEGNVGIGAWVHGFFYLGIVGISLKVLISELG